jgi:hypothetical protein
MNVSPNFVLPNAYYPPSSAAEFRVASAITLSVRPNFLPPELGQ